MKNYVWPSIMAIGIALSGFFIYMGISKFSDRERCVTVKGLSEREVMANRVIWPMSISVTGNDLQPLYSELEEKKNDVIAFLKKGGVKEEEIFVASPSVCDNWEYGYEEAKKKNTPKYNLSIDVTVTSNDVPHILNMLQSQLDLLKKGVNISTSDYSLAYEFTDLASLKPEMVEEATKNARSVAEKFAKDAECSLGSISSASQGQFSIEDDYHRPCYKNIRVVTTVSYYLK